ncbi:MAG TPA: hypothetical protein V6C78_13515 [Crinalium sp.]
MSVVLTLLSLSIVLWLGSYNPAVADSPTEPASFQTMTASPSPVTSIQEDEVTPAEPPAAPDPAVSSPVASAGRLAAPLNEALLGHWMTNSGETHAYFSPTKMILVNQLQSGQQVPLSYKQAMVYEVTSINEQASLINLKVQTRLGWAQARLLRFAPDRQAFTESMDILGHAINNRWTYVDDQRQPA